MPRPRLALFSPVRPVASGISDYTQESLSLLTGRYDITLFLDGYQPSDPGLSRLATVEQAADCEMLHELEPFDAFIYHLGNSPVHAYLLPFVTRHPGLLILHDNTVLPARLHQTLSSWRGEDFRREMADTYGERGETAAEIILTGLHNHLFLRLFSLTELLVRASLVTAVHDSWSAAELRRRNPGATVEVVPHYVAVPATSPGDRERFRAQWGLPTAGTVIGSLGLLTPDKEIGLLIEVFARLVREGHDVHLLLAGAAGENLPLDHLVRQSGVAGRIVVTGHLPSDEFRGAMASCDLLVQLRWPTRRESSAIVQRAMAAGVAVVMSDLAHHADYPADTVFRVDTYLERESLYRELRRAVSAPPLRQRRARAAQARLNRTASAEVAARRWFEIIDVTIARSRSGRSEER